MSEAIALEFGLARPRDAAVLAHMCRDMIEHGLGWRWRTAEIRALINDPDTVVLCARRRPLRALDPLPSNPASETGPGGYIAGFGVMRYELVRAHLMLLAVRGGMRRRGIGAHLLHWLERTAVTAGIERIGLEVRALNAGARQFYRDQGYEEHEYLPRYYSGIESAFRMQRKLRPSPPKSSR
jgi:[ribosomal protein S18]-alanine N-acetyltransferase